MNLNAIFIGFVLIVFYSFLFMVILRGFGRDVMPPSSLKNQFDQYHIQHPGLQI